MRFFCVCIGLFFVSIADQAQAGNPQYRCEPGTVAEDAVAIAFPDVDVAAFSDPDNDICTFAIGGATIGGPSRGDVSPIAEVIERLQSGEVEPFVFRLLIPRSSLTGVGGEFGEAIGSLLSENLEQVLECISALLEFEGSMPQPVSVSDLGAFIYLQAENDIVSIECSVFKPGGGALVRSPVPVLRLYSQSEGSSDSLYVPSSALE